MRARKPVEAAPVPIIALLQARFADLPPALARVAKHVINYPLETSALSIEALANVTESGEASIMRLVQMLGFSGFRAFKLALVAQCSARAATAARAPQDAVERLRREMVESLESSAGLLDRTALARAAATIQRRRHVAIYGGGVSAMIGQILAAKLMRAGIWAVSHADPNLALELMGPASRDSVALAISDSGTTPETVRLLRAARAAGAATIAVTSRDPSPITQHADTVLLIAPIAQPPRGGFVTSIAAQIFVVQALIEQLAASEGAD